MDFLKAGSLENTVQCVCLISGVASVIRFRASFYQSMSRKAMQMEQSKDCGSDVNIELHFMRNFADQFFTLFFGCNTELHSIANIAKPQQIILKLSGLRDCTLVKSMHLCFYVDFAFKQRETQTVPFNIITAEEMGGFKQLNWEFSMYLLLTLNTKQYVSAVSISDEREESDILVLLISF